MTSPIERDCICPDGELRHGEHEPECDAALKAKLLGAVALARQAFYGAQAARDGRN